MNDDKTCTYLVEQIVEALGKSIIRHASFVYPISRGIVQLLLGGKQISSFDTEEMNVGEEVAQSAEFGMALFHVNVKILHRLVAFSLNLQSQ